MKPSVALERHRETVRKVVSRHRAGNVRVFGSVLEGVDRDDSDLDLLVDTTSETTLMDIGASQLELRELLGVEVDVLPPNALPNNLRDGTVRYRRVLCAKPVDRTRLRS